MNHSIRTKFPVQGSQPREQPFFYFLKFFFFRCFFFFFFNLAALGLHCCLWAFSSCSEQGYSLFVELGLLFAVASRCRAQALREAGFSTCSWRVLEHRLRSWWYMSLVAPRHVESSQIRDRTRVPCIDRRTPNHWTTREVLYSEILDQWNKELGSGLFTRLQMIW